MKLRIKGPNLRLRLTQGEMRALDERHVVEEQVPFAPGVSLTYRLRSDPGAAEISASYREGVLEVRIPERAAQQWSRTEQVTLAHEQPVEKGALRITLEKDWACLAPRSEEDESDNFPHPGEGRSC